MSAHIEGYGPYLDAVNLMPTHSADSPFIPPLEGTSFRQVPSSFVFERSLPSPLSSERQTIPMTPEIAVSQHWDLSFMQRLTGVGSRELTARPMQRVEVGERVLAPNEFGVVLLGEQVVQDKKFEDQEVREYLDHFPYGSTEILAVRNRVLTPDDARASWKKKGFIGGASIVAVAGPVHTALKEYNREYNNKILSLRRDGVPKSDSAVQALEKYKIHEVMLLDAGRITDDGHVAAIDIGFMQGGVLLPLKEVPGLQVDNQTVHKFLQPHKMSVTDTTLTWHMPSNPFAAQQAA
jgi:hypothetical protein